MPDLGAPVGALVELLGPSVRVGVGVLLRTALGAQVLVGATTVASAWLAAKGDSLRPIVVAVLVAVLGAVLGVVVAFHRAVGRALVDAVRSVAVGRRVVGLVFDRLVVAPEGAPAPHGERGAAVARLAERIPLQQAEERLSAAARRVLGDVEGTGLRAALRRRILSRVLAEVRRLTLARFREADQEHGGVDLVRVRAALEDSVDEAIAGRIESGVEWSAAIAGLLYVAASLVAGWLAGGA